MDYIVEFFRSSFINISVFLNSIQFSLGGYNISFFSIMWGAVVVSIIISVFWKGGKT